MIKTLRNKGAIKCRGYKGYFNLFETTVMIGRKKILVKCDSGRMSMGGNKEDLVNYFEELLGLLKGENGNKESRTDT